MAPVRRSAPTKIPPGVDMPTALSLVGVTGITAYFGLLDVGRPEPGQTVVVSGAVDVGSSARSRSSRGCRVVGIAGGARNCDWLLNQLGVDEALDHRGGDLERRVAHACPEDITSSSTTSTQRPWSPLLRTAPRGRVVLCVAVSSYWRDARPGITHHVNLIVQRCTVQGFLVFDYTDRYGEAVMGLAEWSAAGSRPGQGLPTIPT
ncbi:NADP-dependent oxidoreductase [Rhodococcus sp. USK13]|uniref:NADP-dependent oxidoreductase n=1 Tax=Rhodococcus sp. USK13 TaxID=2806442 RepID=UPI001BCF90B3|nr:NADP-dependent oxidoreductase [Rhodococcus sp. USK13]